MTPEEIASRLVTEYQDADVCPDYAFDLREALAAALHTYGKQRAAEEREACAKVASSHRLHDSRAMVGIVAQEIAALIRGRSSCADSSAAKPP